MAEILVHQASYLAVVARLEEIERLAQAKTNAGANAKALWAIRDKAREALELVPDDCRSPSKAA